MNKSKIWKIPALSIGAFLFLFLITEICMFIKEPFLNSGCSISISEKGFLVEEVFKDSPADQGGIKKGIVYDKLNSLSAPEWLNQFHKNYKSIYRTGTEDFYSIGKTITLTTKDNHACSFTITNQSFFKKLSFLPPFLKAKIILSIFLLLSGISCTLFFNENRCSHLLVYCLYCSGLGLFNAYNSIWQTISFKIFNLIMFDISSTAALSFVLIYIRESLKDFSIYKRAQKILLLYTIIMQACILIKYILILIFKWDILSNPLDYLTQVFITVSFIPIGIFTIITFIKIPSQTTYLFRFLMIGLALSTVPSIIYYCKEMFSDYILIENSLKTMSIVSFSILPFSFLISILQVKFQKFPKLFVILMAIYIYCITALYILILFLNQIEPSTSLLVYLCVLLSPVLYTLIYWCIKAILLVYSKKAPQRIKDFTDKLNLFSDAPNICKVTAEEMRKIIDPEYIFFQLINDQNDLYIPYMDRFELSDTALDELLYEADSKKYVPDTNPLFNGGFFIPLIKNNELFCRVFIGPKTNKDDYMPSELAIISSIANLFFQTILYKEKILIPKTSRGKEKYYSICENAVSTLSNLIETRYIITNSHIKRMEEYVKLMAKSAKENKLYPDIINNAFIEDITKSVQFHDIGKIIVRDSILKKPGRLTAEEFEQVKIHTSEGEKILRKIFENHSKDKHDSGLFKIACEVVKSHHEWWNGTGYPYHLEGQKIPVSARIVAIADVFDTIIFDRCYKTAVSTEEAFNIISEDSSIHFDPELVNIFLKNKKEILEIVSSYKN